MQLGLVIAVESTMTAQVMQCDSQSINSWWKLPDVTVHVWQLVSRLWSAYGMCPATTQLGWGIAIPGGSIALLML